MKLLFRIVELASVLTIVGLVALIHLTPNGEARDDAPAKPRPRAASDVPAAPGGDLASARPIHTADANDRPSR
ncbi:MAG: hypothetical protein WDO13_12285 [Verrucomicrobiota bacterium]